MTSPTHTPGPWAQMEKGDGDGGLVILGPDRRGVANTVARRETGVAVAWSDYRSSEESLANARLISSAPDLLAALHYYAGSVGPSGMDDGSKARAALARATGEESAHA